MLPDDLPELWEAVVWEVPVIIHCQEGCHLSHGQQLHSQQHAGHDQRLTGESLFEKRPVVSDLPKGSSSDSVHQAGAGSAEQLHTGIVACVQAALQLVSTLRHGKLHQVQPDITLSVIQHEAVLAHYHCLHGQQCHLGPP